MHALKRFAAVVLTMGSVLNGQAALAQTYLFWDNDGVGAQNGGAGQWNTTQARWTPTNEGSTYQVWNNASGHSAAFDDTGGAVTLAGPITVNVLATVDGGYSIGNGSGVGGAANTITFSGPGAGVFTTGFHTTTLTAVVSGTLVKTGIGTLHIDNTANPGTSKYVVNQGAITAPQASSLGAAPGSLVPDYFMLSGGGLAFSSSGVDLGATRGITIGASSGFLGAPSNSGATTISAPIVGASGGALIVQAGVPFIPGHAAGGVWILSNTNNSWNGPLQLNGTSGSGVRLGTSNVIPDTAVVSLTATGVIFDMATNNASDTVKSLSASAAGVVSIGSTGTLTLDNPAGETSAATLNVAFGGKIVKNGTGALTLSGGSGNNNAATGFRGEFILNDGTLGFGTGTMLGGSLTPSATLTINGGNLSNPNAGNVNMNAALNTNLSGNFSVDDSLNATPGILRFNGGTQTIRNSDRTITVTGNAVFDLAGVVAQDGTDRSVTKAGSGVLQLSNAANTYNGNTTILAGRLDVDGDGSLGTGAGTVNLSGGALNAAASRTVAVPNGVNVTADSAITTTSNAASVAFELSGNFSGSAGTLTFRNDGANDAGDTFRPALAGSGVNFNRPIVVDNGATGKTELNLTNASGTQEFSGDISGSGSVVRSGPGGASILSGGNTYSGGTIINSGTLYANSTTGSSTGSGAVTVNGGTLGGTGIVGGAITVHSGGAIAPGMSIGDLLVDSLTFNDTGADATFHYEIDSSTMDADTLFAVTLSLTGATLNAADIGGNMDLGGTKFTIAGSDGPIAGAFNGLPEDAFLSIGANVWQISYVDDTPGVNGGAGSVFVTIVAVVPETSPLWLGGAACALAAARCVVRRRSAR
jgi:fibronectin-binding autotransporter adhesin